MNALISIGHLVAHTALGLFTIIVTILNVHNVVTFTAPISAPISNYSSSTQSTFPAIGTLSTSTLQKHKTASPLPKKQPPAIVIAASTTTPALQTPAISPDVLNTQTRSAIVNILCTTQTGGYFEPLSGSGVFIDPRGVILTAAHVAQFFLLRDYPTPGNINCVIRTGSPARAIYTAILLYLSPDWINANASDITQNEPTGTGENDYAFLLITGTTDPNASLPTSFPYLKPSDINPNLREEMYLASYPAGFLEGIGIQTGLYLSSAYATVEQLFIFKPQDQWVDLFSIPGTILSQAGSSGGVSVRAQDGTLAGIIVTSTASSTTAGRDLRAISIAHIEHSLQNGGFSRISDLLSGDINQKALIFNQTIAPLLEQKLISAINQ